MAVALVLLQAACELPSLDMNEWSDVTTAEGTCPYTPSGSDATTHGSGAPSSSGPGGVEDPVLPEVEEERVSAIAQLNAIRSEAGLAPVRVDRAIQSAAQRHAEYLLDNDSADGAAAHTESPDLDGFSGEHYWERMAASGVDLTETPALGEVVATHPRAASAVVHWMETAYHRLPLLSPNASSVGYGQALDGDRSVNVMNLGAYTRDDGGWPTLVPYPAPNAIDVPLSWDGLEYPAPPAPPGGFPSGPVISLSSSLGVEVRIAEHLVFGAGGASEPHVLLSSENDPNLERSSAVVLYPTDPLQPEMDYTVHLTGTLDGVPFERRWTFRTRPAACQPGPADGCGAGKACYHTMLPLRCEYEGVLPAGAACRHANECRPGTTCFHEFCQPYCAPDATAAGDLATCAERCPNGHVAMGGEHGDPALCLPPPCDPHADACGEGRWCTWAGSFVCGPDGALPVGARCDGDERCLRGSACLDLGDGFRCRQFCTANPVPDSVLPLCQFACSAAVRPPDDPTGVAFCQ